MKDYTYEPVRAKEDDDNHAEEEEDLLRAKETYDSEEEEYYSDNDNDDDSTDSSSWKEVIVWSAWRQHAVAIGVAFLATLLMTLWQRSTTTSASTSTSTSTSVFYSSSFPHEHLEGYHRTANLSFCAPGQSHVHERLQGFDFYVPRESLGALKLHYYADALEDDDYQQVLGQSSLQQYQLSNPEFQCLEQLEVTTTKSYVVGYSYFYQPPAFSEMYPQLKVEAPNQEGEEEEESTASAQMASIPSSNKKGVLKPASLSFTGFGAKFINLSRQPVLLFWDGKGGHADSRKLVGEMAPFDSLGTATTPGQSFSVSPVYDSSHALDRWVVTAEDAIQVYQEDLSKFSKWTLKEQQLYQMQKLNLEFAQHYLIASHRHWLAHFPRRFPVHPLYPAEHVGQRHSMDLGTGGSTLNQLQVVSVTPRVFVMDNFLSLEECQSLIQTAQQQGLQGSTLYAGGGGGMAPQHQQPLYQRDRSTRSSTNTWLGRDTSFTTDQIYQRAARLLNLKEELLRQPSSQYVHDDHDNNSTSAKTHSIAESLQVVRYEAGQEYTAHHDFVYPSLQHRYQPTRYATLLLYLNDDFVGGQTNFPRAMNPDNHQGITIQPKQGKAVLFYNVLPDGNVDDLSQHTSWPVESGEKWLANLWVWDPVIN